jgi:hypothetical protein
VIAMLASDDGRFVTGTALRIRSAQALPTSDHPFIGVVGTSYRVRATQPLRGCSCVRLPGIAQARRMDRQPDLVRR